MEPVVIHVCSAKTSAEIVPDRHPSLIIRIINSDMDRTVPVHDDWTRVLYVEFDDIERGMPNRILFDEERANRIIDVIESENWKTLVIHCGAGMSRSPAVMMAILDHYKVESNITSFKYPSFSRHVYRVMRSALEKR